MSDSSPTYGEGPPALPAPTPFDPEHDPTNLPVQPTGAVVLLLAGDPSARWAAESALELCSAWARSGRRIVLADLHFENPVLHELIGEENLEGVVDVFFYGASVSRSARPVPGRGFYLIPAGTYPPDEDAVYRHPRWSKLVAGFRDSSASLVLFAPAEAEVAALAEWISDVYLLGGEDDLARALSESGVPVRAHLVPPDRRTSRTPTGAAAATTTGRTSPPPHPEEDPDLHLPPPPVRAHGGGRSINVALWLALTIIVLMAIGSVVGRLRPDLLPWLGGDSPAAEPAEQSRAVPPADPLQMEPVAEGEPLPYSVQLSAFNSLSAAVQRLYAARDALPETPLFVSPEEIDGIVYYRVLAGALADTSAARRLSDDLLDRGLVTPQDAAGSMTLIQNAPLAFGLSAYADQQAARTAVDSLLDRNIPAYAVAVPQPGRTTRWQLYAGAYRDSSAAEVMRTLLASAGVSPPLVTRSGIPAAGAE
jgi:hypothetical protein